MASFEVLMLQPGMPQMTERLEPRVALRKLYEAADRDAMLAVIAPNIRAVISTVDAPVDAALMRRLPKLEIVVGFGVGYDHIDAAWAGQHGIVVTHTPGVLRGRRRPRHRPHARRDAPPAAGRALFARGPLAKRALSSHRLAQWPRHGYPRTRPHRQRDRQARRSIQPRRHLPRPGREDDVTFRYYALVWIAEGCDILVVSAPGGAGSQKSRLRMLEALGPNGVSSISRAVRWSTKRR